MNAADVAEVIAEWEAESAEGVRVQTLAETALSAVDAGARERALPGRRGVRAFLASLSFAEQLVQETRSTSIVLPIYKRWASSLVGRDSRDPEEDMNASYELLVRAAETRLDAADRDELGHAGDD
jgi:hypothetical protein